MVTFSFSMMRMIFLIVLLSEQLHVVMGRTIYVDATSTNPSTTCTGVNTGTACPTIESGLLLARNNDTVLIEPGLYTGVGNEGLVFGNSSETIVGVIMRGNLVNGSDSTVSIVCSQENRFLAGVNNFFSRISDLSVDNCQTPSGDDGPNNVNVGGGGLHILRSAGIDIVNVAFTNNSARYGGGVMVEDSSSVVFSHCSFVSNVAIYWGGGLKTFASGVTILSSLFTANSCDGSLIEDPYFPGETENVGGGGAVHANQGSISVISSQFVENTARSMAGAFCVSTMGSAFFQDVIFKGNSIEGGENCFNDASCRIRGGALVLSNTKTDIIDSNFTSNVAITTDISKFAQGGALYVSRDSTVIKNTDLTLTRLLFSNNSAVGFGDTNSGGHGGAIFMNGINIFLSACTFEWNFAISDGLFTEFPSAGGALYLSEVSTTTVNQCTFFRNSVDGGRAGAVFATDSAILTMSDSTLKMNSVTSSYNFKSHGGAISIAQRATAEIYNCSFRRNFANPKLLTTPRTYSGVGGAMFVESAYATIVDCYFLGNYASSGQFDSGGSGGALGIENCDDIQILRTIFMVNTARGYDDTNTYSSSGSGGAISSMFSSAYVDTCLFAKNMVTAGGAEFSVGGAVAVFYDFIVTANTPVPPPLQFHNCEFDGNSANGEVCSQGQLIRAGQGGAVAIIGVSEEGVLFNGTTFTRNIANTESEGIMSSFGGAVYYALGSKASFYDCSLLKNVAYNGLGDDVCSGFSGDNANDIEFHAPRLDSVTYDEARAIHASLLYLIDSLCESYFNDPDFRDVLTLPKSVSSWNSRWDKLFNNIADPWQGVEFVEEPTRVEVGDSYGNNHRNWGIYAELMTGQNNFADVPWGDLSQFPSILVSSGFAKFVQPSFINISYQICAADLLGLLAGQGQGDTDGDTSDLLKPSLLIVGDVRTYALEIVGFDANVTIIDQESRSIIMVRNLVIMNSTLYHSNNINVRGFSAIIGCTITSFVPSELSNITIGTSYMPVITYQGPVVTGFPSAEEGQLPILGLIQSRIFSSETKFMRSSMRIVNRLSLSSLSQQDDPRINNTFLYIALFNRSTVIIEKTGELLVDSFTQIITEDLNLVAILNFGLISIGNNIASDMRALRVYGNIYQAPNATTMIRISNDDYNTPALLLASNFSFFGNLNVTTVSDTTFIPSSDSDTPSSWKIIEYFNSVNASSLIDEELRSHFPNGLYFDETTENSHRQSEVVQTPEQGSDNAFASRLTMNLRRLSDAGETETADGMAFPQGGLMSTVRASVSADDSGENGTNTWEHIITSSAMSCSARNDYYDFDGKQDFIDYRCYVCLKNASCGYCSGEMSGCQSTSSGCDGGGGVYFHEDNCCPDGCNNRGTCQSNDDYTSFTCNCDVFWDGSNCDELSIFSYLLSAVGFFSVVIALITLRYYFKYRHQKHKVLTDLRENLLGGTGLSGMTNQSFLQGIQQDLILRDVFVPYGEIKLEKKIGEGSFGEVFLATFRGAQVAIKQMRAPVFLQFTDNDIEEFRKEAYMMSRLRHPNIVLVMGVSMLEQEAPLPPPGYDDDEVAPPRGRQGSTDSQGGGMKRTASTDLRGGGVKKPEMKIRSVCIITEYLEQGSLADILYGHNKVSDDVWTYELVLTCALQAARGMLYLHSYQPPICHRDLKSSNLVVDDHWVVKVTDFGMSRIVPTKIQNIETGIDKDPNITISSENDDTKLINEETGSVASTRKVGFDESANESWERESFIDVDNMMERNSNTEMTSNLGTTAWCAPELLAQGNKTKYSVKVDVYSFGMVLWELWERKKPYEEMTSRFDIIDAVRAGRRPPISTNCPPTFRSLIQRCWHELPARRPTFAYIVRYIKDELAHIKRQRTMSTTFSPYSISHLLNAQSSSGVDPSAAAKAVQRAYKNSIASPQSSSEYPDDLATPYVGMNGTYQPPPIEEGDESNGQRDSQRYSQRDSLKKSSSLLSFMFKSSTNSDNQSVSSATSLPAPRAPNWADRNTIGGEGIHQGPSPQDLSHLANTPKTTSYMDNASSSSSSGEQGGAARRSTGGQWRDKYVLKFNGWNSTKPDSNLPPPSSSSSSSSSRSTQSPLHGPSASTSSSSRGPSVGVLDEQSSEGSNARHPSFEDSKEVYAHGELLQPRSTYELDLMSSSRSMDPRMGSEGGKVGSQDNKELQRKRTNSL